MIDNQYFKYFMLLIEEILFFPPILILKVKIHADLKIHADYKNQFKHYRHVGVPEIKSKTYLITFWFYSIVVTTSNKFGTFTYDIYMFTNDTFYSFIYI